MSFTQIGFAWRYLLASAFNRQTRTRARQVADRHYDLGNQLHLNMLDRRMVYTCARWDHASRLDEAQEVKLDFVCQKLGLRPGMHLLDIRCGWGSLARFAVQKYGVRVTGVTHSREQLLLGQEMCARLPIELDLQDYRDLLGPSTTSHRSACSSTSVIKTTGPFLKSCTVL